MVQSPETRVQSQKTNPAIQSEFRKGIGGYGGDEGDAFKVVSADSHWMVGNRGQIPTSSMSNV